MTNDDVYPATVRHSTAAIGRQYDPFDPAFCTDPYPFYARARQEASLVYSPQYDVWLVPRYQELTTINKDPARFSSRHTLDYPIPLPEEVQAILNTGYPEAPGLFNNDPPAHTRVRALVSTAFTPQRIAALEPVIRAIAHDLVDRFIHAGETDLMASFAYPLPMTVIADLLGVPREDMPQIKAWHTDWLTLFAPASVEEWRAAAQSFVAYQEYYARLIAERQKHPRDDLTTALVQARFEDAEPLSVPEVISQLMLMLSAGHETTTSLIGSAVRLLLERREIWQALAEEPSLIPAAIDETVRLESPVQMESRITTEAVEVGGVALPAGTRVHLLFASANRDEAFIANPDQFNLSRPHPQRHVGFGYGIHMCIGARLARLEGRVALEVLRERLPQLRLAPGHKPSYEPSFFFRSPRQVAIAWDAARQIAVGGTT